ncbi:hypothetical protein Pmar_PMAR003407, partial [Perkinsus marinus ATCC 50983]
ALEAVYSLSPCKSTTLISALLPYSQLGGSRHVARAVVEGPLIRSVRCQGARDWPEG